MQFEKPFQGISYLHSLGMKVLFNSQPTFIPGQFANPCSLKGVLLVQHHTAPIPAVCVGSQVTVFTLRHAQAARTAFLGGFNACGMAENYIYTRMCVYIYTHTNNSCSLFPEPRLGRVRHGLLLGTTRLLCKVFV